MLNLVTIYWISILQDLNTMQLCLSSFNAELKYMHWCLCIISSHLCMYLWNLYASHLTLQSNSEWFTIKPQILNTNIKILRTKSQLKNWRQGWDQSDIIPINPPLGETTRNVYFVTDFVKTNQLLMVLCWPQVLVVFENYEKYTGNCFS